MNESKEHIITVASKLFLQKNFKEVTMKEIVDKTGLSKGAFYHYFESKEQLFLEVHYSCSIHQAFSFATLLVQENMELGILYALTSKSRGKELKTISGLTSF